ncbi:hypothetical protein HK103_006468 [Boothiomyces macroporosus]|uniref:Uncharacterized protein n=1 Tax=Boothiomyces macroporosus TaxID=261099 RepID=A0AAD5UL56_9FUNG|nr:hypothetical protein HK103_006468 [Boothiomyces macroporosus]
MKNEVFTKEKPELLDILSNSDTIIKKTDKKNFDHYSKWFNSFPDQLKAKEEMFLSKDELISIVHWKLMNGTFRPGFIKRVEQNTDKEIMEASKGAFEIIEQALSDKRKTLFQEDGVDFDTVKSAINQLTKLHGIGVATATGTLGLIPAILSCAYNFIPFMSDQALYASVAKQKYQYTMAEYQLLYTTIISEAKSIGISPRELERAIWCNDVGNKQKEKIEKKYKRKPDVLESKNKKKI